MSMDILDKAYTLHVVRVKNKFASEHLTPAHLRFLEVTVRLSNGENRSVYAEIILHLKDVLALHEYHCTNTNKNLRSLLLVQHEHIDEMLHALLATMDRMCPVPMLLSLFIAVMAENNAVVVPSSSGGSENPFARFLSMCMHTQSARISIMWRLMMSTGKDTISSSARLHLLTRADKRVQQRDDATASQRATLPLSRVHFYRLVISQMLSHWSFSRYHSEPSTLANTGDDGIPVGTQTRPREHAANAYLADRVIGRIALYNIRRKQNVRIFTDEDVQITRQTNAERHCWNDMVESVINTPDALQLIQLLGQDSSGGMYQFAQRSVQEYLAAYATLHAFRPESSQFQVSWSTARKLASTVTSTPFLENLVQWYLLDTDLHINMADTRRSCLHAIGEIIGEKGNDTEIAVPTHCIPFLRALTTQATLSPTDETIDLSGCVWVTDDDLGAWSIQESQVHAVDLRSCHRVTDDGIVLISKVYRHLRSIVLADTIGITNKGLTALFAGCPELMQMNVSSCWWMSDSTLCTVALYCSKLTQIDLRYCHHVTENGLLLLVEHCKSLTPNSTLSLVKGDRYCIAVAKYQPNLTEIDLRGCSKVTEAGLCHLAKAYKSLLPDKTLSFVKGDAYCEVVAGMQYDLTSINLRNCRGVTEDGLLLLVEQCPQLLPNSTFSLVKGDEYCMAVSEHQPDLTEIDLRDCSKVTEEGLCYLAKGCKHLLPDKTLSFEKGNTYCGVIAEMHPNLTSINLEGCTSVTERGLCKLVRKCENLLPNSTLSFAKGDNYCAEVAKYQHNLTGIDLSSCPVTEAGLLKLVENCPRLRPDLTISFAKGDQYCAAVAFMFPGLSSIDLSRCGNVGDNGVRTLARNCERLDLIKLETLGPVTENGLVALAKNCQELLPDATYSDVKGDEYCDYASTQHTALESIDLSYCEAVTETGLTYFAERCQKLLPDNTLSYCKGDRYLESVAKVHPKLTSINLSGCVAVTDAGIIHLSNKCVHLQQIDLSNTKVTDPAVQHLLQYLRALTHLNLCNCKLITDAAFDLSKQKTDTKSKTQLQILNLCGCENMTEGKLNEIIQCSPYLGRLLTNLHSALMIHSLPDRTQAVHMTCLFNWVNLKISVSVKPVGDPAPPVRSFLGYPQRTTITETQIFQTLSKKAKAKGRPSPQTTKYFMQSKDPVDDDYILTETDFLAWAREQGTINFSKVVVVDASDWQQFGTDADRLIKMLEQAGLICSKISPQDGAAFRAAAAAYAVHAFGVPRLDFILGLDADHTHYLYRSANNRLFALGCGVHVGVLAARNAFKHGDAETAIEVLNQFVDRKIVAVEVPSRLDDDAEVSTTATEPDAEISDAVQVVLCVSECHDAASIAGIQNPDDMVTSIAVAECVQKFSAKAEELEASAHTDPKSFFDSERLEILLKLKLSSKLYTRLFDDKTQIIFKRDWKLPGNVPFRASWSSGFYLEMLQSVGQYMDGSKDVLKTLERFADPANDFFAFEKNEVLPYLNEYNMFVDCVKIKHDSTEKSNKRRSTRVLIIDSDSEESKATCLALYPDPTKKSEDLYSKYIVETQQTGVAPSVQNFLTESHTIMQTPGFQTRKRNARMLALTEPPPNFFFMQDKHSVAENDILTSKDFVNWVEEQRRINKAETVVVCSSQWHRGGTQITAAQSQRADRLVTELTKKGVICKQVSTREQAALKAASATYAARMLGAVQVDAVLVTGPHRVEYTHRMKNVFVLDCGFQTVCRAMHAAFTREGALAGLQILNDYVNHETRTPELQGRVDYEIQKAAAYCSDLSFQDEDGLIQKLRGTVICISPGPHMSMVTGISNKKNEVANKITVGECVTKFNLIIAELEATALQDPLFFTSANAQLLVQLKLQAKLFLKFLSINTKIIFKHDWELPGRVPFDATWSSGWYLRYLQDLGVFVPGCTGVFEALDFQSRRLADDHLLMFDGDFGIEKTKAHFMQYSNRGGTEVVSVRESGSAPDTMDTLLRSMKLMDTTQTQQKTSTKKIDRRERKSKQQRAKSLLKKTMKAAKNGPRTKADPASSNEQQVTASNEVDPAPAIQAGSSAQSKEEAPTSIVTEKVASANDTAASASTNQVEASSNSDIIMPPTASTEPTANQSNELRWSKTEDDLGQILAPISTNKVETSPPGEVGGSPPVSTEASSSKADQPLSSSTTLDEPMSIKALALATNIEGETPTSEAAENATSSATEADSSSEAKPKPRTKMKRTSKLSSPKKAKVAASLSDNAEAQEKVEVTSKFALWCLDQRRDSRARTAVVDCSGWYRGKDSDSPRAESLIKQLQSSDVRVRIGASNTKEEMRYLSASVAFAAHALGATHIDGVLSVGSKKVQYMAQMKHPVEMECGARTAQRIFRESYRTTNKKNTTKIKGRVEAALSSLNEYIESKVVPPRVQGYLSSANKNNTKSFVKNGHFLPMSGTVVCISSCYDAAEVVGLANAKHQVLAISARECLARFNAEIAARELAAREAPKTVFRSQRAMFNLANLKLTVQLLNTLFTPDAKLIFKRDWELPGKSQFRASSSMGFFLHVLQSKGVLLPGSSGILHSMTNPANQYSSEAQRLTNTNNAMNSAPTVQLISLTKAAQVLLDLASEIKLQIMRVLDSIASRFKTAEVNCRVDDKQSIVRGLIAEVLSRIKKYEGQSRYMPSLSECVAAMHNVLYFTIILPRDNYTEGVKAIEDALMDGVDEERFSFHGIAKEFVGYNYWQVARMMTMISTI